MGRSLVSFASLARCLGICAALTLLTTTGSVGTAVAGDKTPPKAAPAAGGGVGPTKDEVWNLWDGKDTEKYIRHESCPAGARDREWQDTKWVYFSRACVKLTVQAECGCTTYTITYKKYESKGSAWILGAVQAEFTEVACPTPLAKEVLAKCKADKDAREKCDKAPAISALASANSEETLAVIVDCPATVKTTKGMAADPLVCGQCKVMAACYSDAAKLKEATTAWGFGCSFATGEGICRDGSKYDVAGDDDGITLWCPEGYPNGGPATKAMCGKCVPPKAGTGCHRPSAIAAFKAFCAK